MRRGDAVFVYAVDDSKRLVWLPAPESPAVARGVFVCDDDGKVVSEEADVGGVMEDELWEVASREEIEGGEFEERLATIRESLELIIGDGRERLSSVPRRRSNSVALAISVVVLPTSMMMV